MRIGRGKEEEGNSAFPQGWFSAARTSLAEKKSFEVGAAASRNAELDLIERERERERENNTFPATQG